MHTPRNTVNQSVEKSYTNMYTPQSTLILSVLTFFAVDDFEVVVNNSCQSQQNNTGHRIADHGPVVDSGLWTTGKIPMRDLQKQEE